VSREQHPGWTAPDGLHPTAAQYARWAELAVDPAVAALKN
jgi:lysophospholipase L1-like esterase